MDADQREWRDLHLAAYNADIERVRVLLDGDEDVNGRDASGFTPLHWSCFRGIVGDQQPVVAALLAAGADTSAITNTGDTCLIWATQSGNVEIVEQLASAGADVDQAPEGVTPLMVAARRGDERMVETLIRLGADPTFRTGSFNAAAYASHGGHDELAAMLTAAEAPRS